MSYILDALRRADLERDRGAVPGLHTQGLPPLTGENPATPRLSFWVWGGVALAALAIAGLVWALVKPESPALAPQSAAARDAATATSAAPAAPPVAAASSAVVPAPTQPVHQEIVVVTVPARAAEAPPRPAVATAPPPGVDAPRETAAPQALAPQAVAAKPAWPRPEPASAAAAAPPRIHALHELPAEVRRAIPPLVVNGSVYSKNPADRFLIVNGLVAHESDSVAPDVVLETIGPRSAVLSAIGHRFEISY